LWAHDLVTPTVEAINNFDKMLCLSEFHKDYTMAMSGVKDEKIVITRNGIDPDKFKFPRKLKNPNKVVWMSSPDRGLDRCMRVCDILRKDFPNIELHVYYGLDNLYKYGLSEMADRLKKMMDERPWVKYHGMTEQSKMMRDVSDAVLWLHPCDFIETFCITALEMLVLGVFPVTRSLGALKNTLHRAEEKGQAILLSHDCITDEEHQKYADAAAMVLTDKRWENVSADANAFSWESIADEWIEMMNLKKVEAVTKTA
jgi:glycosyltransferase involved in cell wall biosynthesis